MKRVLPLLALLLTGPAVRAEGLKPLLDVPYGKHPRQVKGLARKATELGYRLVPATP
jgi:hypothetical protein